jgi:hypothetical protein
LAVETAGKVSRLNRPRRLDDDVATPSGILIGYVIVALTSGITGFLIGALLF